MLTIKKIFWCSVATKKAIWNDDQVNTVEQWTFIVSFQKHDDELTSCSQQPQQLRHHLKQQLQKPNHYKHQSVSKSSTQNNGNGTCSIRIIMFLLKANDVCSCLPKWYVYHNQVLSIYFQIIAYKIWNSFVGITNCWNLFIGIEIEFKGMFLWFLHFLCDIDRWIDRWAIQFSTRFLFSLSYHWTIK